MATAFRQEVVRILSEYNFQGEAIRWPLCWFVPRVNGLTRNRLNWFIGMSNLTNAPTLFRGAWYIDKSLQRKIVLHLLLAGWIFR